MNPNYNDMWGNNGGSGFGSSYGGSGSGFGSILSGAGSLIGGMFGNSGQPYQDAMNQYSQWAQQGANEVNPYNQAGQGAISGYQNWLSSMQNPTQFTNNLMNNYQESPNAKFMQNQAVRSAQNAGSATGMVGSTPYTQQVQQNAENISQQDMGNWMQNVLGLNSQYGQGEGNLINAGEQGANSLLGLYGNEANAMGEAAYGKGAGQNQDKNNVEGGIGGIINGIGSFFGL